MARSSLVMSGVLVMLSVGIVGGMYLLVGRDTGSAKTRPDGATQELVPASAGVRAASIDSARRGDPEPESEDALSPAPSLAPADIEAIEQENALRRAALPPPEPPPPEVAMTDEQRAANEAYNALREQVEKDVGEQLNGQQSALKKACWKDTGGAVSAEFSVNASFDAEGKMVSMGISDVRGPASAAGVGQCLRQQAIALNAGKLGQGVSVDMLLRLP